MATSANRDPPTTLAYCVATAILAGLGGYFMGQATNLGLFCDSSSRRQRSSSFVTTTTVKHEADGTNAETQTAQVQEVEDSDTDSSEGSDDLEDFGGDDQLDLQGFEDAMNEECKLVLVVRTDLGMTKGKIAAQCGHATLACYKALLSIPKTNPAAHGLLRRWERYGQAKVAVQVKSEEEMETLQATAMSLGICARIIHDAGRTQIAAGSATVMGIGPAPKSKVDLVTKHLKLL